MKNVTKITSVILILLFIFSLASCGTLKPALNSDTDSDTSSNTDATTDTSTDSDVNTDVGFGDEETGYSEDAFTVALRYNGVKYIPEEPITVYWKNSTTLESSTINSFGYAGSEKLDGDYKVSISGLPEGKIYNPNVYEATNNNKNIVT